MFQLPFQKYCTVTIYMKSDNKIVCDKVIKSFTYTYVGNTITKISNWEQVSPKNKLLIGSLDLSQIEAIVCN